MKSEQSEMSQNSAESADLSKLEKSKNNNASLKELVETSIHKKEIPLLARKFNPNSIELDLDLTSPVDLVKSERISIFRNLMDSIITEFQKYELRETRASNDQLSYILSKVFSGIAGSSDPTHLFMTLYVLKPESLYKLAYLLVPSEIQDSIIKGLGSFNPDAFHRARKDLMNYIAPLLSKDRSITRLDSWDRRKNLQEVIKILIEDPSTLKYRPQITNAIETVEYHLKEALAKLEEIKREAESKILASEEEKPFNLNEKSIPYTSRKSNILILHRKPDYDDERTVDFLTRTSTQVVIFRMIQDLEAQYSEVRIEFGKVFGEPKDTIQGIPLLTRGEILGKLLEIERQLSKAYNFQKYSDCSAA